MQHSLCIIRLLQSSRNSGVCKRFNTLCNGDLGHSSINSGPQGKAAALQPCCWWVLLTASLCAQHCNPNTAVLAVQASRHLKQVALLHQSLGHSAHRQRVGCCALRLSKLYILCPCFYFGPKKGRDKHADDVTVIMNKVPKACQHAQILQVLIGCQWRRPLLQHMLALLSSHMNMSIPFKNLWRTLSNPVVCTRR
jgi:hypothetical protein